MIKGHKTFFIILLSLFCVGLLGIALSVRNALNDQQATPHEELTLGDRAHDVVAGNDMGCEDQYQKLLAKNKADLSQCGVSVDDSICEDLQQEKKLQQVVVIFDASGSMAGVVQGQQKIDIAKRGLRSFAQGLGEQNVEMSVIVYGHKGSNLPADKAISCNGIEEVYKYGAVNESALDEKITQFGPVGWTPIAEALNQAASILNGQKKPSATQEILLISDGEETCDGDPNNVAQEIADQYSITTNVIAFDVNGDVQQRLSAIASSGGGTFYEASSSQALLEALEREREKYWHDFSCGADQWQEWLDSDLSLNFNANQCASDLHWEKWSMIDMGTRIGSSVSAECRPYIEQIYRDRYIEKRNNIIKMYTRDQSSVNAIADNNVDSWQVDVTNNLQALKAMWDDSWDDDIVWE
jgi:Ca-activated chloride channel homolog